MPRANPAAVARKGLATRLQTPDKGPHGLAGTTTVGYLRDLMFNVTGRIPDDRRITFADNYAEVAGS